MNVRARFSALSPCLPEQHSLDLDGGRAQEQGAVSIAPDGTVLRDITAYYSEGVGMITTGRRAGPEGGTARFRQTFKAQSADRILTALLRETAEGWVPTFPGSDRLAMIRRAKMATATIARRPAVTS